jgi:hypothetical protein
MVLKLLLALVLTVIVGVVGAVVIGGIRWRAAVEEQDEALIDSQSEGTPLENELLPEPVRRFMGRAVPASAPNIGLARLTQSGTFQMGEGDEGWRPFESTEVMSGVTPGFYWDAAIKMAPGVIVRVRDSYINGSAEMVGKILGIVPVVDAPDDVELRQGALSRYLAESAWIPTRLRMGPGLTWRGLGRDSAEATLVDGAISVSLRFTFDAGGDLVEVYGQRQREAGGEYIETPWIGRFRDHRKVAGYRIPFYGEVAWVIAGEEQPYWRGTIVDAEFNVVRP